MERGSLFWYFSIKTDYIEELLRTKHSKLKIFHFLRIFFGKTFFSIFPTSNSMLSRGEVAPTGSHFDPNLKLRNMHAQKNNFIDFFDERPRKTQNTREIIKISQNIEKLVELACTSSI